MYGKIMKEAFLDQGQWFLLFRDAKEFSECSAFAHILTEFITQLKPTNVFPSSFDYEVNLEDYKSKILRATDLEFDDEQYFNQMDILESQTKI